MIIRKLSRIPYGQCHVVVDDNQLTLVSYTTEVITIRDGWMAISGLYSMTTRKHISAFLKEYVPTVDYALAKKIYEMRVIYNIYTGEIIKY